MKTIIVNVADLKQHPLQHEVFGDLNAADFGFLMSDIETHGLRQPPEVTADLMLIDGHQRVRAYKQLGKTEIEVIVRDDLDSHESDLAFVETNSKRRQLDNSTSGWRSEGLG